MSNLSTLVCSTCQGLISPEELAQGLAVRIDGQLVCSNCVDLLPGRAQLEINRFRALKGLTATTYSVEVPGHPDHHRFTFTTSGNVLFHRRAERDGGTFSAPPLPAQTREPLGITAGAAAGSAVGSTGGPAGEGVDPGKRGPERSRQRSWLPVMAIAAGVIVVLAVGITLLAMSGAPRKPGSSDVHAVHQPTRADYPEDAAAAWAASVQDRSCPAAVAHEIGQELRRSAARVLGQAAVDLDHGKPDAARAGLDALQLPEDLPGEPWVADMRGRVRTLSSRLAQAEQHVGKDPKPVHTPESGPEPQLATPTLEASPESEAPLPDSDGAAIAAGPECWLISSDDLMAAHPGTFWKAGGELTGLYGTLERQLPPLTGGRYQAWVKASASQPKGDFSVLIDGRVVGTLQAKDFMPGGWKPLRLGVDLSQGPCTVTIKVHGASWRIASLYLAGGDRPGPEGATASAPPWLPLSVAPQRKVSDTEHPGDADARPQAHATIGKEQRMVATWAHAFVWPQAPKEEPLDGSANLPSPWPSGAEPFHRSQRPPGPKHAHMLELELAKADVDAGGVVILVHRVRADRKSLSVAVESQLPSRTEVVPTPSKHDPTATTIEERPDKVTLPLEPLTFSETGDWQVFSVPFPDLGPCGERLWLKLEDVSDLGPDRGFLLGKVVTVTHGAPSPTDLELMAPPLVAGDVISNKDYQRKLVNMLTQVAAHRAVHKWNDARTFDARKVKLLVTNPDKTWETEMRRQLARVLGVKDAPRGCIDNLALADNWFADKQFKGQEPLLDPDSEVVAAVCLNGEEAGCSLKDPQVLDKWMRTIASNLMGGDKNGKRGGFIPVIVIGRTEKVADFAQQSAIDTAWLKVRDDCTNTGLPLIDIRGAQSQKSKTDVRVLAAQLLADGLRTLAYQVSWAQSHIKQ